MMYALDRDEVRIIAGHRWWNTTKGRTLKVLWMCTGVVTLLCMVWWFYNIGFEDDVVGEYRTDDGVRVEVTEDNLIYNGEYLDNLEESESIALPSLYAFGLAFIITITLAFIDQYFEERVKRDAVDAWVVDNANNNRL